MTSTILTLLRPMSSLHLISSNKQANLPVRAEDEHG